MSTMGMDEGALAELEADRADGWSAAAFRAPAGAHRDGVQPMSGAGAEGDEVPSEEELLVLAQRVRALRDALDYCDTTAYRPGLLTTNTVRRVLDGRVDW